MPTLKLPDTEIYYEVHGDGPPFLFCSVTGLDHQAWKFHQVPEFSRDHKVIVFDYRGTGKSSKTIQKYSIKMFTDDAAALLDHLNVEQAIVCGHSMGGVVAQLLALDYPRKVIGLGPLFNPTGDKNADLAALRAFYQPFRGKHRGV